MRHILKRSPAVLVVIGALAALVVIAAVALARHESGPAGHRANAGHPPRVVYLGPADAYARNLVLADLQTGTVTPLTAVPDGVEDFAVSPAGNRIAYARNNDDGTTDIWLLDISSGATVPVTRCVRAMCSAPAWKPDASQIAYQRREFGGGDPARATRVWVVDLPALDTRLLFDDSQILGMAPAWSPDGQRIAVYDPALFAIRVHDVGAGTDALFASETGSSGAWSPDGTRLVYPVLVRGVLGQEFYTHLRLAELPTGTITPLSGPEDAPVDDTFAAWSPDGSTLLVARRYLDARYTAGKQLYLLDVTIGSAQPLVVDAAYNHAVPRWDVSGRRIVFQRFSLAAANAQPEVWTFDLDTGTLTRVAGNAFFPAWLP